MPVVLGDPLVKGDVESAILALQLPQIPTGNEVILSCGARQMLCDLLKLALPEFFPAGAARKGTWEEG